MQAETTDILLAPTVAPQALVATTLPGARSRAAFTLNPAIFNDGPYLDPFTNGVQATPGAKSGVVGITLAFPAYDATKAYAAGSFVTSSSINYESLQDQNVNNTPASSPTFWATTSAGAAINNGQGFLGTDIGRLVRLFSEPAAWLVGDLCASTAASPVIVSYNPTGQPGAATYWSSLARQQYRPRTRFRPSQLADRSIGRRDLDLGQNHVTDEHHRPRTGRICFHRRHDLGRRPEFGVRRRVRAAGRIVSSIGHGEHWTRDRSSHRHADQLWREELFWRQRSGDPTGHGLPVERQWLLYYCRSERI